MYTAVAKVSFWNENKKEMVRENVVLTNVTNFTDAMKQIEGYYGDDLDGCNIRLLDMPFLYAVPDEEINRLMKQI